MIIHRFSSGTLNTKKFSNEEFLELKELVPFVIDETRNSIRERVYCLDNKITSLPICPECGLICSFLKSGRYAIYCSSKCSANSKDTSQKRENTSLERYGVKNPIQNPEIREKADATIFERYGVKNAFSSDIIQAQIEQTNLERYGVKNPMQNVDVREKGEQTNLIRYGVKNPIQNPEIREKADATIFERYGVIHSFQSKEIREKGEQTNLIRYGVKNPIQNPEIREKADATIFERYGVKNAFSSDIIQAQIEQTNLERYGVKNPMQNVDIANKTAISLATMYNERKNESGKYTGFIYFLYFEEHKAIKIGTTHKTTNRFKALEKDFGKFEIIKIVESDDCFGDEFRLHQQFSEYRICLEKGAGRTEFFKSEILEELLDEHS